MTKTKINVIEKLNNSPSKDPCRKEIDDEEERGDSADCKTPLNRRNQIMLRQDFDNLAHDVFALYCTWTLRQYRKLKVSISNIWIKWHGWNYQVSTICFFCSYQNIHKCSLMEGTAQEPDEINSILFSKHTKIL